MTTSPPGLLARSSPILPEGAGVMDARSGGPGVGFRSMRWPAGVAEPVRRRSSVEPVADYDDEVVVGYVGSFGPHRGLETAIDAMPELLEARPDARLLLVGSAGEEAYDEALRQRCRDRGIEDRVTFTGWVDLQDVPNYIAACDVPFVVHERNPHTATTVPHKLFQYMALRKPVLVSTVPTLARPVAEYDAGHAVDPGDTAAFADACVELGTDRERYAEMAANARRAVEERYNWARAGERLVAVYDGL